MNDKIQLKRGTLENWLKADPILMDGEMALVATNPATPNVYDQYKVGGGSKKFSELPYHGLPCLQGLGDSTTSPMSQKAVSDIFTALNSDLSYGTKPLDYIITPKVNLIKNTICLKFYGYVTKHHGIIPSGIAFGNYGESYALPIVKNAELSITYSYEKK